MKRSCLVAGAALLLIPSLAAAEARQIMPVGSAKYFDILATNPNQDDLQFGRQLLPPSAGNPTGIAQSRVIYLNHKGVTLQPGNNDSRTNRSTLAQQAVAIPAWNT